MEPQQIAPFEPAPIDLPAATVARARALLIDLQQGHIDRAQFDEQMNVMLTDERLRSGASFIASFGEPREFTPVEERRTAEGVAALFRVAFASGKLTWVVRVNPEGKINGFDLRRSLNHHIYNVVNRSISGY
jgi:hypothetical protein